MVCSLASPWQTALKLSNLVTLLTNSHCFSRPSPDIASLTVWSRVDVKFARFEHLDIVLEYNIMDLKDSFVFPFELSWGFRFLNHFFRTAFIAAEGINFRIKAATSHNLQLANLYLTSYHSFLASCHGSLEGIVLNFLNSWLQLWLCLSKSEHIIIKLWTPFLNCSDTNAINHDTYFISIS